MKKTILLTLTVFITVGCMKKEEIINGQELLNVENRFDYISIATDFEKAVDTVFNYPYSRNVYNDALGEDGQFSNNPMRQLFVDCLKNGNLKIKATKYDDKFTSYKFESSQSEIKNCIVSTSNKPMKEIKVLSLSNSSEYKEYKDNPILRKKLNDFKSDGVISIKEYMDIIETINKLEDIDDKVKYKNIVKDL